MTRDGNDNNNDWRKKGNYSPSEEKLFTAKDYPFRNFSLNKEETNSLVQLINNQLETSRKARYMLMGLTCITSCDNIDAIQKHIDLLDTLQHRLVVFLELFNQ